MGVSTAISHLLFLTLVFTTFTIVYFIYQNQFYNFQYISKKIIYEQRLYQDIKFYISNVDFNPINQTLTIDLLNIGNFKLPSYKFKNSIYIYIYGDINNYGPYYVNSFKLLNDNYNVNVWDNGEVLEVYLNLTNVTESYYSIKVCIHYDVIEKCEEYGNLYIYKPIIYKVYNPNNYDLIDYELRLDISDVISKFGYKFKIYDENYNQLQFCFEKLNGECGKEYNNYDYIWVKVNLIANTNTTIFFIKDDKNNAVDGKYVFWFYDDFSINPNLNPTWEIYRYSYDLANECYWDKNSKTVFLVKNVTNKACIMFIREQFNYPFIIKVRYRVSYGNGADGMALAFDKNITPFRLYNYALAGGFLGEWARDVANGVDVPSDGYIVEIDNYDNGVNDPTSNYIALARTNSQNGGFPIVDGYYPTVYTRDGNWHTLEVKVNSSYVNYIKLDGFNILQNIQIQPLGNNYIALSAATGGLYYNYEVDYIIVKHYAYLEPIVYK